MLDESDPRWVDPAVVLAAQRGDSIAMNTVLDRLGPYVGRICGSIALQRGPDAAQETLIVLMRSLRSLRDPVALAGWVRTIAVREAVRVARREPASSTGDLLDSVPAAGDPMIAVDVRDVLGRLSPEHRAVLVLRDMDGMDEAAAAALLRVPEGTVKSRLHRARRHFKREWTA